MKERKNHPQFHILNMNVKLTVTPEKQRKEKFCRESVMVHWIWPPNQTPFLWYLSSSGAGFHWAGKQSVRHVSFSTESPGAGKWGCCHPVGFECFITAYTEEQLPTARSLTSGQQCRRSRRGLHCPATTPASTRTQAVCAGMKDDLERTELLGTRATSLLIIQKASDNGLQLRTAKNCWISQFCCHQRRAKRTIYTSDASQSCFHAGDHSEFNFLRNGLITLGKSQAGPACSFFKSGVPPVLTSVSHHWTLIRIQRFTPSPLLTH